jgi:urease accessory protein
LRDGGGSVTVADRTGAGPGAADGPGLLHLTFRRDAAGRSVVRERQQRFPLRTTTPFYLDTAARDMAFVYVQNPTGGVFAGDRLLITLAAEQGARVHLTTQSATKLYRMDAGEARQELRFELGAGAYIEHIPDPLIPQAGAIYRQHTSANVADGAVFVTAETIAPGRRAHGERFAYELLELATEVRRHGREVCSERLCFEPRRARPDRAGVLGRDEYLVSLLVIAPDHDTGALATSIDAALAGLPGEVRGAAGQLPHGAGVLMRMLAPTAASADRALRRGWAAARASIIGLPLPERRK